MVKLVWTEISRDDLKEIFDFIAQDSTRYASITVNRIYSKTQVIIGNPFLGRIVPEFNDKSIREVIVGNYRIIYRIVNEHEVDILRVFHSARSLRDDKIK